MADDFWGTPTALSRGWSAFYRYFSFPTFCLLKATAKFTSPPSTQLKMETSGHSYAVRNDTKTHLPPELHM